MHPGRKQSDRGCHGVRKPKVLPNAQAFADPTRLTLAAALLEGEELCVCDLSWISGRKQALVSHHLRTLRDRSLVRSRRAGKLVMYSLTGEGQLLLLAVLGQKTEVSL